MNKQEKKVRIEKAVFGAGCFWHVEDAFSKVKGVVNTTVGFMGGTTENPSYKDVCTNKTGHAEVCLVEYNPEIISYAKLLDVFWNIHNPMQLNRQGPDIGSQYKTVIFYYTEKQKSLSIASMKKEEGKHDKPIVTMILPAGKFYKAEEYHQRYFEKNNIISCGI
jgi:peptide-methionine (S)-S-oxide reductase